MGRLGVSAAAIVLSALSFSSAAQAANTTSWPSIALVPASAAERVTEARSEAPPCTRKIKVVYSGYGEADRAGCTTAAAADNNTRQR